MWLPGNERGRAEEAQLRGRLFPARCATGIDLVRRTEEGWAHDTVGTGTHAAGVIAAADTGKGIIGTSVDAEIEVCQVLPGAASAT